MTLSRKAQSEREIVKAAREVARRPEVIVHDEDLREAIEAHIRWDFSDEEFAIARSAYYAERERT